MRNGFLTISVLTCITIVLLIYKISRNTYHDTKITIISVPTSAAKTSYKRQTADRIVLSVVVCDRLKEALTLIKSVLLFTKSPIYFVIFTDDNILPQFNHTLSRWKELTNSQLNFELQRINFPEQHKSDWLKLFKKCAAQRLFIPSLLPHIDAMIYLDVDTLLLGPADELWNYFYEFNSTQMSAVTVEDDNPNVSWYPRFAKHPFYGKYGINSGVMLMNLTRMRTFHWVDYVTPIMLQWKIYIPWGDQDIINIIFHYHPELVYLLSCRYNYRSEQCMYGDACADGTRDGVFVLHGSRWVFHSHKSAFLAVYTAISEYEIGAPPLNVVANMEKYFTEGSQSNCGNLKNAFMKVPNQTLLRLYGNPVR